MSIPEPSRAPSVVLERPDGVQQALYVGDLIGRSASAAMLLDAPQISEAHAMVSLRRGRLLLLALRRRLAVEGRPAREVILEPGLRIALAHELELVVVEVRLPAHALQVGAPPRVPMRRLSSVASLYGEPRPRVVTRFEPLAPAHAWHTAGSWRARAGADETREIEAGSELEVDGVRFVFGEEPLGRGMRSTTRGGAIDAPLSIVSYFDTIEILQEGREAVVLSGVGARILTELGAMRAPVEWETVAREVWSAEPALGTATLRRRWDVALIRLRRRMVAAGLPSDLLRSDGNGMIHLVLQSHDRFVHRS